MQIMTKINDFEEIFFEGSIIFHVFAHRFKKAFGKLNSEGFFFSKSELSFPYLTY